MVLLLMLLLFITLTHHHFLESIGYCPSSEEFSQDRLQFPRDTPCRQTGEQCAATIAQMTPAFDRQEHHVLMLPNWPFFRRIDRWDKVYFRTVQCFCDYTKEKKRIWKFPGKHVPFSDDNPCRIFHVS